MRFLSQQQSLQSACCAELLTLIAVGPLLQLYDTIPVRVPNPSACFGSTASVMQGHAAARQLPLMQRIVVANRAAAMDSGRLHDSYSEIDYDSPYKGKK